MGIILSLGTFCSWDVLSLGTFCPKGQPARLDRSGNRVFTHRKATTSIGLKPMRLAVHYATYNTHGQFIPALQHTTTPAVQQTTTAPATPAIQ